MASQHFAGTRTGQFFVLDDNGHTKGGRSIRPRIFLQEFAGLLPDITA